VAVGALAVGGIAQADVIDSVGNAISRITGVPYVPVPNANAPESAPVANSIYTDPYGHRFQVDAYGRYTPLDQYGSYRDQWGRTIYLDAYNQPIYIEQNGALIPYSSVAMAPRY
jgi:hypothetical protein